MKFTNPFDHDNTCEIADHASSDVIMEMIAATPPRNSSLGTNFSYHGLSRHESSSSVTSTGSMPGMTDASDSDLSFEDDCNYNTSASELFDSFWPDNSAANTTTSTTTQGQYPAAPRTARNRDYFNVKVTPPRQQHQHDAEDDAIRVSQSSYGAKVSGQSRSRSGSQASPSPSPAPRPGHKRSPVTYSVYPLPAITALHRPHPPRSTSLGIEPPSPLRSRPQLRTAKSSAALKSSRPTDGLQPLNYPPPPPRAFATAPPSRTSSATHLPTTAAAATTSVPVSPACPSPRPKTLRPSKSAFNLRDSSGRGQQHQHHPVSHNVTAPLVPLLPSAIPEPQANPQPSVSVFDFDSEDESNNAAGESGFAKRIARGLRKKSASESGGTGEKKVAVGGGGGLGSPGARAGSRARVGGDEKEEETMLSPVGKGGEKEKEKEKEKERERGDGSLGRKRGGSLGRLFGRMSR
ncbi:hypothetical protein F5Y15DRAFT_232545 [Xylariaceae sp. FL0016]|nr:hypothetical protein F5Y15DRAFT_232545 [Xylariaceae sp. FL0016]